MAAKNAIFSFRRKNHHTMRKVIESPSAASVREVYRVPMEIVARVPPV